MDNRHFGYKQKLGSQVRLTKVIWSRELARARVLQISLVPSDMNLDDSCRSYCRSAWRHAIGWRFRCQFKLCSCSWDGCARWDWWFPSSLISLRICVIAEIFEVVFFSLPFSLALSHIFLFLTLPLRCIIEVLAKIESFLYLSPCREGERALGRRPCHDLPRPACSFQ